jgi:hypothetical protein
LFFTILTKRFSTENSIFRIRLGIKPGIGPLARSRVSCIRITLRSIGFAFTGFGGFVSGVLDAV